MHDEFLVHLALFDAINLAATCQGMRRYHLPLFASNGNVDFLRLTKKQRQEKLSDIFIRSVLALSSLVTPRVTSLNLEDCEKLTNESITAVNYPTLTSLNSNCCRPISEEAITGISCPFLTNLSVANCTELSNVGLQEIAVNCPAHFGLDFVTDASIKVVARSCPALTNRSTSLGVSRSGMTRSRSSPRSALH